MSIMEITHYLHVYVSIYGSMKRGVLYVILTEHHCTISVTHLQKGLHYCT